MRIKRGNIVGAPMSDNFIETVFRGLMSKITSPVFADENPDTPSSEPEEGEEPSTQQSSAP